MKILIIGGSGLIGGHAALHLSTRGHQVTIGSRSKPAPETPMAMYRFQAIDFASPTLTAEALAGFDAIVFSAGKDPRDLPEGGDAAAFWTEMNVEAVPRFFELARQAGVRRVVNVGTFYPWVAPHLAEQNLYIASRAESDWRIHALGRTGFDVISLNPPLMIGYIRGLRSKGSFVNIIKYARGERPDIDIYAPTGGVHFMSTQSLAEAIEGALLRGEPGKSYLVGDENYSYHDYFKLYFNAVGREIDIPVLAQAHPLLGSFAGVGGTLYYEPDPETVALLGYRRRDVVRAVAEVVQQYA